MLSLGTMPAAEPPVFAINTDLALACWLIRSCIGVARKATSTICNGPQNVLELYKTSSCHRRPQKPMKAHACSASASHLPVGCGQSRPSAYQIAKSWQGQFQVAARCLTRLWHSLLLRPSLDRPAESVFCQIAESSSNCCVPSVAAGQVLPTRSSSVIAAFAAAKPPGFSSAAAALDAPLGGSVPRLLVGLASGDLKKKHQHPAPELGCPILRTHQRSTRSHLWRRMVFSSRRISSWVVGAGARRVLRPAHPRLICFGMCSEARDGSSTH